MRSPDHNFPFSSQRIKRWIAVPSRLTTSQRLALLLRIVSSAWLAWDRTVRYCVGVREGSQPRVRCCWSVQASCRSRPPKLSERGDFSKLNTAVSLGNTIPPEGVKPV